jgi:hypothetical protein
MHVTVVDMSAIFAGVSRSANSEQDLYWHKPGVGGRAEHVGWSLVRIDQTCFGPRHSPEGVGVAFT